MAIFSEYVIRCDNCKTTTVGGNHRSRKEVWVWADKFGWKYGISAFDGVFHYCPRCSAYAVKLSLTFWRIGKLLAHLKKRRTYD